MFSCAILPIGSYQPYVTLVPHVRFFARYEVKVNSRINQAKQSIEEQQERRSNISLGSSSEVSSRSKSPNSYVCSALANERARQLNLKRRPVSEGFFSPGVV